MTSRFVSQPRAAALSVAITVFAASIGAAQVPVSVPPAAIIVTTALVGLPGAAVDLTTQPRQIPPFDGVWKLNVDAIVHPNGPALPARGPWPDSFSSDDDRPFGLPEARARAGAALVRLDAMPNLFFTAPPMIARLVQQSQTDVAPVPVVADPARRIDLLREGTGAMARQAQAASAKAPQQKSWASRHKVATGFIIAGAIVGGVMLAYFAPCFGGSPADHCE